MVAEETLVFLRACLLGAGLGVLYDLMRILRIALPHGTLAVAMEDICYFVSATIVTFGFVLAYSDGELRMFILAGELAGGVIYFVTISILLMKLSRGIIALLKKLLRLIYKLFLAPFVWLFCKIFRLFRKIIVGFGKKVKKILGNLQIGLKTRGKLLYNKKKHQTKNTAAE